MKLVQSAVGGQLCGYAPASYQLRCADSNS